VEVLRARGAHIVGPEAGRLASGASGAGRMADPDQILAVVERVLDAQNDLAKVRVLVTAGPTFEPIDPVRFIGNRSSGKMGFAIAEEARNRGARVTLVTGPTALPDPHGITVVHAESHKRMRKAVVERAGDEDVIVMAAAISDFRPAQPSSQKLKRTDGLALDLVPTEDIAAEAARVAPGALHVGFALETGQLLEGARDKMRRKGQRIVVANALSADHNPFGSDSNRVAFLTDDEVEEFPEMPKHQIARLLWDRIASLLHASPTSRP
jgi:phosphopantothenoylcysteine decarboxylase/phosphopantothenate--cysteine ligase